MTEAARISAEDYYERLGVARGATGDTIKKAYRALVRQYTPEREPEQFKRIREAYETLSDPRSRQEYDSQPSAAAMVSLHAGMEALQAERYADAERHFKQFLVQEPGVGYVRNLLGLTFLYQEEPAKAVAQYERLLREPDAPAAWFGNAGHAYGKLKQWREAEEAFREAARRATETPVDYLVALADLFIGREDYARAVKELELAIQADGRVDFDDLRYFTKLLEVRLIQRDAPGMARVIGRIEGLTEDQQQRQFVAWRLAMLARELIHYRAFSFARPLVEASQRLQPGDQDYVALLEVTGRLERNDIAGASRIVDSHPSFASDGWLVSCGEDLRPFLQERRFADGMIPINRAPPLYTVNGIGTFMWGERDLDAATNSYETTLYLVFVFIPLIPLARYRVVKTGDKSYSFLGRYPLRRKEWIHTGVTLALALWLYVFMNSSGGTDYSSSTDVPVDRSATAAALFSAPGTDSSPPSMAGTSSGDPERSYSALPSWYNEERAALQAQEVEITLTDSDLEQRESQLKEWKRRIDDAESGDGELRAGSEEYDALVSSYNEGVDAYNARLAMRNALVTAYQTALRAFNVRVEEYNSSR